MTLILPPNNYMEWGKYPNAYIGMIDVDAGNGHQRQGHINVTTTNST